MTVPVAAPQGHGVGGKILMAIGKVIVSFSSVR
jgi:hypothetical protein